MLSPHAALRFDCPIDRMLYWAGESARYGQMAHDAITRTILHNDDDSLAPTWAKFAMSAAERALDWRTRVVALPHATVETETVECPMCGWRDDDKF